MLTVDKKVLDDIGRGFSVPAQPRLLLDLMRLMADKNPDLNKISATISKDIAISAAILKTINSPLYGLSRTMTDIKKSVSYIGLHGIVMLVTNCLIKKSFDQKNCSIALEDFWRMTNDIASIAVFIGKQLKPNLANDKLFSLALFHDCGVPVMAMKFNDYQATIDNVIATPKISLPDFEEQHYQVNHATIGYYVATSWRLPKDICQIILQHHDRNFLTPLDGSEQQDCFAILKLAEHILSLREYDRPACDWPYLQGDIVNLFGLTDDDLLDLIDDVEQQVF